MNQIQSFAFSMDDYAIFDIPGFSERMDAIRLHIRPKLRALAEAMAPRLALETGLEFHPHVATHARRRVNPPDDTWLSLSRSHRGYKRYAHLSVGISRNGTYVRMILKAEADDKDVLAQHLQFDGLSLFKNLAPHAYYLFDHDHPDRIYPLADLTVTTLQTIATGLKTKKSAAFGISHEISSTDPRPLEEKSLLDWAVAESLQLIPIYQAALPS